MLKATMTAPPALKFNFHHLAGAPSQTADFSSVTEHPGIRITRESLAMLLSRYSFASEFCKGKEVLEVACGAGMGLGLLASQADRIVGGDLSESLLRRAQQHYRNRIPLLRLDAQSLPLSSASFDVILLFEAIYYLADPPAFLRECRRVLRPSGVILICAVNPEIPGFNPSPFSIRYFRASELQCLLRDSHFLPEIRVAFPLSGNSKRERCNATFRSVAVRFHLLPKTMKGKQALKRIFLGPLAGIPAELAGTEGPIHSPVPMPSNGDRARYRVLFAIGRC
jgi:ubiquinone/menaquinone biosynthesis C-methylase UbiE